MKAHIIRDQNALIPTVLCWNLSAGDRGKLDGMAGAFGMRVIPVLPADADKTVAELLSGTPDAARAGSAAAAGVCPAPTPAILMANFSQRDFDTLLDLLKAAEVNIPLKAAATKTNRTWAFAALLDALAREHAAFAAQKP